MPLYDPARLLLIAGPCTLESEAVVRSVAGELVALRDRHPDLNLVFKGSYDKANRTAHDAARGPGMAAGLELLALVRREYDLPVLTDIHTAEQAAAAGRVCEVLQVPAFLCRQTDLLLAAAATGRVVNVKKGQFLAPADMAHVAAKLAQGGAAEIWLTERGTTFGYHNLVVDMRGIPIMARQGYPVVLDATHSVQLPGGGEGRSAGQREFVEPLAKAALAAGAHGLFLETHPDPDHAVSDGPNMVPLAELAGLVERCRRIWRAAQSPSS
jgi:2-dehydro-3-deoxyphosphooctonate aldolase (KDO 8-P synthase)